MHFCKDMKYIVAYKRIHQIYVIKYDLVKYLKFKYVCRSHHQSATDTRLWHFLVQFARTNALAKDLARKIN